MRLPPPLDPLPYNDHREPNSGISVRRRRTYNYMQTTFSMVIFFLNMVCHTDTLPPSCESLSIPPSRRPLLPVTLLIALPPAARRHTPGGRNERVGRVNAGGGGRGGRGGLRGGGASGDPTADSEVDGRPDGT